MEWAIGISVGLVFWVLLILFVQNMKANIKREVMEEIKQKVVSAQEKKHRPYKDTDDEGRTNDIQS